MSAPRTIGVLGGMGPDATILFMHLLFRATPAGDDADHVPLLVDMNTQVPSRIRRLVEGDGADPAPVLAAMARRLAGAGAEALVMPCNTAHLYADAVRAATDLPFLDALQIAAAEVAGIGNRRVGILGSPALRIGQVFDAALARVGAIPLYPADEAAMLSAIRDIKGGRTGPEIGARLSTAADDLIDRGAEMILIACSEFSMVADAIVSREPCTMHDTMKLLARATRDHALTPAEPGTLLRHA